MQGKALPFWMQGSRRTTAAAGLFGWRFEAADADRRAANIMSTTRGARPGLTIELLHRAAAGAHAPAWRDLAARALEPNAFFEPSCVLAASEHLTRRRPAFILVWEGAEGVSRSRLIGLCPLRLPSRLGRRSLAAVFSHRQAVLGVPLVDRDRAEDAIAAILSFCREALPRSVGLAFPAMPLDGPTARLISRQAAADRLPLRTLDATRRAILRHGAEASEFIARSLSVTRFRKLEKARRRLAEHGEVRPRVAQEPCDIRRATEEFLALEARGWKGRRGTALLSTPRLSTYARTLTRTLAAEGKCRIFSLEVAAKPIAMAVVLLSGDRAFVWKIAYDEAFAAFSPGVQLMADITRAHLADERIAVTDSCAHADHPMIDRLWPDRMAIGDLYVGLDPGKSRAFAAALEREALRRWTLSKLKAIARTLRRR